MMDPGIKRRAMVTRAGMKAKVAMTQLSVSTLTKARAAWIASRTPHTSRMTPGRLKAGSRRRATREGVGSDVGSGIGAGVEFVMVGPCRRAR